MWFIWDSLLDAPAPNNRFERCQVHRRLEFYFHSYLVIIFIFTILLCWSFPLHESWDPDLRRRATVSPPFEGRNWVIKSGAQRGARIHDSVIKSLMLIAVK